MSEKLTEAEISMVLDTFMYLDYKEARDGTSLNTILKDLENLADYGGGGVHYGEYTVLKKAAENEEIGSLIITCQSVNMGYDTGTCACTFMTPDESSIYVVYRGTGDGEWPDNGIGMTSASTTQQERALSYFEQVVETLDIKDSQRLIVTGHSKGGNKAQFVAMETKYSGILDVCYSVDGQGFSEKAIEEWKERYGEKGYRSRTEKLYGIHGENDYVSALGNSIIPKDHIRYVETPVEKNNFAGYHDIKYMFASLIYDENDGSCITVFNGRKNRDVGRRGELGNYAALLSAGVMELPSKNRDGCAAVIMHLMEVSDGQKKGINGERLKLTDLKDFTLQGIPIIAQSLFEEEGRELLKSYLSGDVQLGRSSFEVTLQVNYQVLLGQAKALDQAAVHVWKLLEEMKEMSCKVPKYMKNGDIFCRRLERTVSEVEEWYKKLQKAVCIQENIAKSYQKWDEMETI
ncbi:MAG: DUF2974 domain-containing protein [Lachnospiraceae bacterium]|nr:DUF2974 domain-containing protein [Lachnospiraceae bacterium]